MSFASEGSFELEIRLKRRRNLAYDFEIEAAIDRWMSAGA